MGYMPRHKDIHWEGLDYDPEIFYEIMAVDRDASVIEARSHEELFDKFFDRLPKEFIHHRELFKIQIMAIARGVGVGKTSLLKQAATLWQSQNFSLTYAGKKGIVNLWTREARKLL